MFQNLNKTISGRLENNHLDLQAVDPHTGSGNVGPWRDRWLPQARGLTREASSAETGSQISYRTHTQLKSARLWVIYFKDTNSFRNHCNLRISVSF